ncbi:hypothetical protein T4C_4775 [Trichinella pseudospiralis]|uniref:Apple domain-containing protein n=1 Tax=Trichinella pseudospiralis TaxID=6337 RepID=A0A0V1K5U2_TRIPS|nr:hypothetical protein T4C_4775 [Trichinella pseudospiralis]
MAITKNKKICPHRQCKSILFAVFLKDVHMTCVLEELELSTGWIPFCGIRTVWGKSFDECILICNSLRPENKCNAIKYYQTLMKCYLLTAPKNSRATETQHESHKVIFIYGCSKGSYYLHEIENFSMLVLGGTFISLKIEILNKTFIIERRPTADSILLPIASLLVMRGFGRLDAMLSSIILEQAYVNSVVIKATHNMSYELISESRSPVDSEMIIGLNTEKADQNSTKVYVQLHRYLEVCEIGVIHSGKIENVTSIQIISNVRSINRCLHFCRPWLHQIFYCAVIYTKHNYKCELLKRNTERSITRFVDDESNLIELLNCYPDRQHERRNNPSPVRYYLKQTGEICVLEFYNATQLSGFHLIETLENVENIKSCIYACRLSILFAVFLKDVHMTCVLEELELSRGWIPFCGIQTVWGKSFDECILICNSLRPENKCNAIKYYQTLMKCYLLTAPKNSSATETQHESHKVIFIYGCSKVLPIASLLVMRGFGRLDAMLSSIILEQAYVNSVVIKATHNMSYELISESRSPVGESGPNSKQAEQTSMEAYVHLYRYMEVCKISVIHSGKIENVTSIQIISNVRSINRCLHFCRPWLHQIFYCAVIYTKHNYKCELLKRNTERSITRFVDDESNLIELLNCYPDRQHERRNNPPPMRYYLKQTGEICVLEFYNATQLSSFNPIETLENIENIKSCIYACRLRYFLYLCLAINYTMKKQCTLLRKELEYKIYNVEHRSLFAEILFCEPGTFVNPDYNV